MFDFHLHSSLSFDSKTKPISIVRAAEKLGLSEICLTDHFDQNSDINKKHRIFASEDYINNVLPITSDKILVRHGVEFGMTEWNKSTLSALEDALPFDFVIGSVHYIEGHDPYEKIYWTNKTVRECFVNYLQGVYNCVRIHDRFDVLGHINYVCKSPNNPTYEPLLYNDHSDIIDEIFKLLVDKGKGIEVNTSGYDRVGEFLPSKEFLIRFRELGGEIVTVGSDAHDTKRVGQYSKEACELVSEVFGYVCTFEDRKPVFHKM